jgi:alkanesulfonate monooxygenase SsuD/methylene tetrahydromethanopterin reductase-like flavin-dependent oxidoreductase (luciferase family)
MRYFLGLPTGGACGDPRFVLELAQRAEDAGWDGVLLEDYVWYQGDPAASTCDAWAALAAMAVSTERILLGTSVTPLPRRRPWNVARQAAAIDQLSKGRMILGVGIGDVGEIVKGGDASFTRMDEEDDPRRRAEMLDEGLEIIAGLWTGEPFSFEGKHYRVDQVTFKPAPVQQPRIPILVGGGYPTRGPTERALRWDGSMLYKETHGGPWEDIWPDDVAELRRRAGDRPFEIIVGGRERAEDQEADRRHIRAVAEAGATGWTEWMPPKDADAMRAVVDRGPLRIEV